MHECDIMKYKDAGRVLIIILAYSSDYFAFLIVVVAHRGGGVPSVLLTSFDHSLRVVQCSLLGPVFEIKQKEITRGY